MGDFSEKITVSKTPIEAKADWEEIENSKLRECANCGSLNTVCIYEYANGCIIGWTIFEEFY